MLNGKINVAVVNFSPKWGDVPGNLKRICAIAGENSAADIIVFPETSLTGYDNEPEVRKNDKMHLQLAETIPGPSTEELQKIAAANDTIIVIGMIERNAHDRDTVYNSAAVITPEGSILSYRKIHLPGDEADWASPGDKPMVFDTKWGPIGLSICYDTYSFPELIRYARAKGARLHINCTACSSYIYERVPLRAQLEERVLTNNIYIATAGICGKSPWTSFIGGSSIIGTAGASIKEIEYYAGQPFGSGNCEEAVYSAELDLDAIDKRFNTPIFERNSRTGRPDFAPDIYARMFGELANSEEWKRKL